MNAFTTFNSKINSKKNGTRHTTLDISLVGRSDCRIVGFFSRLKRAKDPERPRK
jgi:hypothetical protein